MVLMKEFVLSMNLATLHNNRNPLQFHSLRQDMPSADVGMAPAGRYFEDDRREGARKQCGGGVENGELVRGAVVRTADPTFEHERCE